MSDEERSIQKNKIIITAAVLSLIFIIAAYILLNSSTNDTVYFHYTYNQNTGERHSLFVSIIFYLFLWGLAGTFLFSIVFLFVLCLYFFLHRKDERLMDRSYHPKYEEEFYYGGTVSFVSSYIVTFVLMVLHISNIATITVF